MNKIRSELERQHSSERALEVVQEEIKALGHNIRYLHQGGAIKTWQCFLDTPQGLQFIGCGKGFGVQSKTSATFEAFEHYLDYQYNIVTPGQALDFYSLNDIKAFDIPGLLDELPITLLEEADPNKKFPWLKYQSLHDKKDFYLPLYLAVTAYCKSQPLAQDELGYSIGSEFSSSSGTASGMSFDEAVVHALNEAIERDANSLFLVKAFIKNEPIKVIQKPTLPNDLQQAIAYLEHEYKDQLVVIDITSDFGIPTFCVSFTLQDTIILPKGYGTSLDKAYAVERALLESLQPLHLRTPRLNQVETNTLERLATYPLLAKSAEANIRELINNKNYIEINFNELPSHPMHLSLKNQKEYLLNAIKSQGYEPYYHIVKQFQSGITCAKVVIPGLDKFYLTQTGKKILPGKRGYTLMNA